MVQNCIRIAFRGTLRAQPHVATSIFFRGGSNLSEHDESERAR